VTPPPPASITVTPASPTVQVGATQQFTATAKDASGNTLTGLTFTWASSATAVATVDASGKATAVAAGTTQITAASGGVTSAVDTLTVIPAGTVTGTAASGSPVAAATVTLKDAAGVTRTGTTAADGTFSVASGGLTPPFLLSVAASGGKTFYSVSADGNATTTINLDPLTDLIIRAWYQAQSSTVDAAFANPSALPAPTPAQVQLLSHVFVQTMSLWLENNGLDPTKFDPIATPFAANGSGLDKVLDETTVNTATGAIQVTDGTTTQNSTVTVTAATNAVSVTSSTSDGTHTSVATVSTIAPTQAPEAAALTGVNATLAAMLQVVTAKGAQLADTDLAPFVASDLIQDGQNATQWLGNMATTLRGVNAAMPVTAVNSLSPDGTVADISFEFIQNVAGSTNSQDVEMQFKNVGGTWLMEGNRRLGNFKVQSEMRVQQGAQAGSGPDINVDFQAPQGTVTGVTLSGGGIWSSAALQNQGTVIDTYAPTPTTTVDLTSDHWYIESNTLQTLVPAGTQFTVVTTPVSGSPVSTVVASNTFTTESVSFTNLGSTNIGALSLGQPVNYTWTLPKTFALARIKLNAQVFNSPQTNQNSVACSVKGAALPITATSGSITLPTTCGGQPVVQADINLIFIGVNGEQITVIAFYQ